MNTVDLICNVQEIKSRELTEHQTVEALELVLQEFVHHSQELCQAVPKLSQGLYSRVLLNDPEDDFQVILVMWAPGRVSPIHDHDDNVGAVVGLMGETEEIKYRVQHEKRVQQHEQQVSLEAQEPVALKGRYITPLLDDHEHQLHKMTNPSEDEWAATVHVYMEAMHNFHVYEEQCDGLYVPKETPLWFDEHSFWRYCPNALPHAA